MVNKFLNIVAGVITFFVFTIFSSQGVFADNSVPFLEQLISPVNTVSMVSSGPDIPLLFDPAVEIDNFFNETDLIINLDSDYDPNTDFALHVADGVALFVDLESISQKLQGAQSITLHPDSFRGGAALSTDLSASNLVDVYSSGVSKVIVDDGAYRELCAFTNQMGGVAVAGVLLATLENGSTIEIGAEVGTSMIGFTPMMSSTVSYIDGDDVVKAAASRLVISWPDKYCRGVKKNDGVCSSKRCGMTLGDMIDFANLRDLVIPAWIISAGVDAVADWLYQEGGYTISGSCGQVEFLWFIPVGCQCVYVTF